MNPLETIRERWLFVHAGVGAPTSNQADITDVVAAIDLTAEKVLARQTPDGNPYGRPLSHAEFTFGTDVFAQLEKLAIAWRCPFSKYSQKPEILERIIAGLRFGEPYVRPDKPRDGSWHSWDISFPLKLCSILLLCGEQIPADLRALILEDLDFMPSKIFTFDRLRGITRPKLTSGSNNMTVLSLGMARAIIQNDRQWLDTVQTQIPVAMGRASGSEGLQPDWSYQFHGHGINAGYGTNDLWVQGHWIYLMQGTPWQVPDNIRELFVGMMREFFARNMWRGRIAPYTIDRGIATPGTLYGGHSGALFGATLFGLLADLPPQDKAVFTAAAADYLSGLDPAGKPMKPPGSFLLTHVPRPIQADLSVLDGIRYYPCSEYLLARQKNWFAAVRMSSGQTKMWNSMLGYNIRASSMAEFSIAFMTDGREFDHTTITTMNWKRLMGVTRCDTIEPPPESYGESAFCGGLAGDEFAVLGLEYLVAPAGQDTLRANKSLFITPDALVLLGSQIRCDSAEPVVTTLFHTPLFDDELASREVKTGETLHIRNVSIKVLCDAQLIVEERQGRYADLNMPQTWGGEGEKPGFFTVNKHRWAYLVVNHGVRPRGGRYGAIITAGKPQEFRIQLDDNHHRVDVGQTGGEVRFPGDWRKPAGCSYWGAEQHQWGSIARWTPNETPGYANLEITSPRRFVAAENAATEIFLPLSFEQEGVTLKTYEGGPFPPNIMSTSSNGKVHKYRARRRGHCQVYTQRGDQVTRLSPAGYFIQPMIDRAGDAVVFWGSELGETGFNIWLHDGTLKKLTDDRAVNGHPFWSADGQQIVYFHSADTDWRMSEQFNLGRTPRNIWIMNRAGQNRRQLTTGAFVDERPCISPDGKTVVFVSDRSGHMNLWSAEVATGKLTQLTKHDGLDYRPIFSPNGDRLAFFSSNNPRQVHDLCIMDWPAGTTHFPVCPGKFNWIHGPYWLPDGNTLLLHALASGRVGVWRFNLITQEAEPVPAPSFKDFAHASSDERETTLAFDSHDP